MVIHADGSIDYGGEIYEMLYYEGIFVHQYGLSNMGWTLEKVNGQLYLEGQPADPVSVLFFLRIKMMESGLEDNEIDFLLNRIVKMDMLSFETNYLFIRFIPKDSVDEAILLEVPDDFSVMRRHYLFESSDDPMELVEPEYEFVNGDHIIHETAVNRI
jgi:hypothetical protein